MSRWLLVLAVAAIAAVALPERAQAQYFAPRHSGGWSGGGHYVSPGYRYGYQPYYHNHFPGRHRGHFDYHPGHFHGYRYVPPHIDYHHRGHFHAANPYTGQISPYRHRHRHHH